MQMVLYGIGNCDKVRAAKKWLDANGVDYEFHDFRKHGASPELVAGFLSQATGQALLNRRSTSWRGLSEEQRASAVASDSELIALLCELPTLIKRPVLQLEKGLLIGFDSAAYGAACG